MSLRLKKESLSTLSVGTHQYEYYRLSEVARQLGDITRLPKSLKVLLENLVRYLDDDTVVEDDIKALVDWQKNAHACLSPSKSINARFYGCTCRC